MTLSNSLISLQQTDQQLLEKKQTFVTLQNEIQSQGGLIKLREQCEKQKQQDEERSKTHYVPSPDLSSDSDIQVARKKGYCYIGSYKGKRTCIPVEKGTECMSGDIFPSMDVCINENLRR